MYSSLDFGAGPGQHKRPPTHVRVVTLGVTSSGYCKATSRFFTKRSTTEIRMLSRRSSWQCRVAKGLESTTAVACGLLVARARYCAHLNAGDRMIIFANGKHRSEYQSATPPRVAATASATLTYSAQCSCSATSVATTAFTYTI